MKMCLWCCHNVNKERQTSHNDHMLVLEIPFCYSSTIQCHWKTSAVVVSQSQCVNLSSHVKLTAKWYPPHPHTKKKKTYTNKTQKHSHKVQNNNLPSASQIKKFFKNRNLLHTLPTDNWTWNLVWTCARRRQRHIKCTWITTLTDTKTYHTQRAVLVSV